MAVVASLLALDTSEIAASPPAGRSRGQLREGVRYVRGTPELVVPLVLMAIVGTLTYEFSVTLPVLARRSLGLGAEGFGYMTAAMGAGAVVGGLVVAARGRTGSRPLVVAVAFFGLFVLAAALAPSFALELAALVLVGAASVSFVSVANSTLQLGSAPHMRGRVMGLWAVAFQGSTPIGGPLIGWIISLTDARAALAVGGVAALAAAALGMTMLHRLGTGGTPVPTLSHAD